MAANSACEAVPAIRRYLLATCLAVLVMSVGSAQAFSDRRLIVAFGDPGSAPFIALEKAVQVARCRLADRDVDVVFIDARELRAIEAGTTDSDVVRRALTARSDASPHATGFELVLIGKDGGVKWRQDDPAALEAMLERIDAMPMRRAEMRRSGGADTDCP